MAVPGRSLNVASDEPSSLRAALGSGDAKAMRGLAISAEHEAPSRIAPPIRSVT